MRKNKLFPILLLLSMITSTTGCKKWLDVSPQTSVRERTLFETEQGFKDALTGVYIYMSNGPAYGQNLTMGFIDALAQRYSATTSTSHAFYRGARYEYSDATTKSNYLLPIWSNLYSAIANTDNILVQIDDKQSVFSNNNYGLIKGEALALRALLHFDLLRCFGAAPIVDGNRKAIPYVTTFGRNIYPLLTVNEVMDSCIKDLNLAAQLLVNEKTVRTDYITDPLRSYTRNHMNYWAVKGLLARIYLYKGDKTNALASALEIINDANTTTNFPFVTSSQASATSNRHRAFPTEHLFAVSAFKILDFVNAYFKTTTTNGTPSLYTTSATLTALYETTTGGSSDFRFNYQFDLYPSGYSTSKYNQENLTVEYLTKTIPIIRLSEMYYIAAECAATPDVGVGYLNTVRTNRGLAALPTNLSAITLDAEILKEYKKEMFAEGQLFFYFKRKNAAKVDGSTITMNDATWIFPLPENEIEFGKRF